MLHDWLQIDLTDTVAIIGSGGKTTLLWALAQERRTFGAFVTTSTHIFLPSPQQCDRIVSPNEVHTWTPQQNQVVAGLSPMAQTDKCTGISAAQFAQLRKRNIAILYEADGSKQMPAKLHRPYEPVIFPKTDVVCLVFGLSALGKPIEKVCHCYSLNKQMKEQAQQPFQLSHLKICIQDGIASCGYPAEKIRIFLNQADTISDDALISSICSDLHKRYPFVFSGCLRDMQPH